MQPKTGSWEKLTVDAIAKELGVSKTTVSRALSGKGRVSESTRALVIDYVSRSGYESSTLARKLEQKMTRNLALVIPSHFVELDLPFMRRCMGGVCGMAAQRGYDVLLCYADAQNTVQLKRQLSAHKIDGVLLSRTMIVDPCLDLVRQYRVPFVGIGRLSDPHDLQVDNDQIGAASELTHLLLNMGMKRIAFLGGSSNYTVNADRLQGYLRALQECGVAPDKQLIVTGIESQVQRMDALDSVLEHQPECIICDDDSKTFSILKYLRARGLRVPEDIRLASLYDSEILTDTVPTISAVQFDANTLGATACRLLLDTLAGREVTRRQKQGYQVILRESTK